MPFDEQFESLKDSLVQFILDKYSIEQQPEIQFKEDHKNSKEILGFTGHYDPKGQVVTVFTTGRHPKDVLRSIAHELIHHIQGIEGQLSGDSTESANDPNYIMYDNHLKNIEADAFERGNIAFREWEAYQKGYNGDGKMDEMKKSKITAAHKAAKAAMSSFKKQYGDEKGEKIAYATMMKAAKKGNLEEASEESLEEEVGPHMDNENKKVEEVVVNDALKNSLSYIPEERPCAEAYAAREEKVYNELLRKFKIKK